MRTVLFLDLDDTIFQTRPKCPGDDVLHPVAHRRDGTPLSFMTPRQRAFLEMWLRAATVIPTTARNLDAYSRVDLPFEHLAILDFGGVVLLEDKTLDAAWDAQIRPRARAFAPELRILHAAVERIIARRRLGAYARVIADFDMPLYVVVKHPDGDCALLAVIHDELRASADLSRCFVHQNDNNLSLVPAFLGKEHAVRHVVHHRLGPEPVLTIGMGDSLTDAGFLDVCDYSLMPRACQLARQRLPGCEGA
ncbi:MAG: haloacid dehalogenase [Planctomycetes bacterium]|nr:haloacid dehalogenase [Planctomycetota bacterium]